LFSILGKECTLNTFTAIYNYTAVSFALSTFSVFAFSGFTIPDPVATSDLMGLCITNIVLCFFLWFRLLKVVPASFAGRFSLLTPFVTLLFIAILLGEKITLARTSGLIIILLGALVQQIGALGKWLFGRM
jgi:drug/metabolite transporter (DMT)-like permease